MRMTLLRSDHGNTLTDRSRKAPCPRDGGSNGFQIDCGRFAVLSLLELVGDLLILVEVAKAGAFHRRDVHEHVLGLVVRLNEAETLARVEPFHGTGRHGVLSMDEVAPRRSVRGIKLVVGETRIGAPRKGCRGLTQVEFDAASMAGAACNSKRRCGSSGGNKTAESAPSAVVPEKKTRRLRC